MDRTSWVVHLSSHHEEDPFLNEIKVYLITQLSIVISVYRECGLPAVTMDTSQPTAIESSLHKSLSQHSQNFNSSVILKHAHIYSNYITQGWSIVRKGSTFQRSLIVWFTISLELLWIHNDCLYFCNNQVLLLCRSWCTVCWTVHIGTQNA